MKQYKFPKQTQLLFTIAAYIFLALSVAYFTVVYTTMRDYQLRQEKNLKDAREALDRLENLCAGELLPFTIEGTNFKAICK